MTILLELTTEETERLEELAQKQGEDIAQVVHDLLAAYLPKSTAAVSQEQWEADLDALISGAENLPVLDPSAYLRESFYGERGYGGDGPAKDLED